MARGSSKQLGNVGVRMVACVTVIVVLVVFFAVNYLRLISMEQDTHTAVEAACLQAARDLAAIVVDGPMGRISLVDDLSVKRPYIPSRDIYSGATPKSSPKAEEVRQIKSINTLMAEIRLRALIANQPEIVNTTMTYRANADLHLARNSMNALKYRLVNTLANRMPVYDKNGREINIHKNVVNAYNSNQQKLGRIYCRLENLTYQLGTISSLHQSAINSLQTPRPADCDPETDDDGGFYRAYREYSLPGLPGESVQFIPDCSTARLVDNATFLPLSGSDDFPCAVQIEGDEVVTVIGPADGKPQTSKIHFKATAQCPAGPPGEFDTQLAASPSGALLLTFPQGFPNVPFEEKFNFYSLISIMNASMLDAQNAECKSPYKFWNQESAGIWRIAKGGSIPGNGTLIDSPYLDIKSRANDDPSVALSFLVYDWLSSLGLKPNVESVVKALTFDLRAYWHYRHNPTIEFSILSMLPSIQPASAAFGERSSIVSGIFNVDTTGKSDPRNLTNWEKNPHLYMRQQARMWSYAEPLSAFPNDCILVKIHDDGSITTTDGNPVKQTEMFMKELISMNHIGWQTYVNTLKALNEKISAKFESLRQQQAPAVAVTNAVMRENPRLANALQNAQYSMAVSLAIKKNLKLLTANGLRVVNPQHFALGTADFYPPTKAPSVEELLSGSPCDTGQDGILNNRDWCGAKPTFISDTNIVELGSMFKTENGIPSAEASTLAYSDWNKFLFHLDLQSPAKAYEGEILMHRLEASPYATVPLLKGQVHYQNTCALITNVKGDKGYKICWQVQARDMNANHFSGMDTDLRGHEENTASYFADMDLNSYKGQVCKTSPMRGVCPPLVSEFSILCPLVKAPMPSAVANIVLWSDWLAPSVVSSSLSNQLLSVESGWQPSIYTPDGTALGQFKGRLAEKAISREWWQDKRWHSDWWLTSGRLSRSSGLYPEPPPLVI